MLTPRKLKNYLLGKSHDGEGVEIQKQLEKVKNAVEDLLSRNVFEQEALDAAVADVISAPEREAERLKREKEERMRHEESPVRYLERFIREAEQGMRYTAKGTTYSKGSISCYRELLLALRRFEEATSFGWDEINHPLMERFVSMLLNEDLLPQTINKLMDTFSTIMRIAYRERVHQNDYAVTVGRSVFIHVAVHESDKRARVFLTREEIRTLEEMKLSGAEDRARDIFLVGCYTCQRVSDYSHIKAENFMTTARGARVIRIEQKKTHQVVMIPILSPNLEKIFQKYDWNIPSMNSIRLGIIIKRVLLRLSKTISSLAKRSVVVLSKHEREAETRGKTKWEHPNGDMHYAIKPKALLVSTHTARRTGLTLMYLSGCFSVLQMRAVSGHKNDDMFYRYIRLSGEDIAAQIDEKMKSGTEIF